MASECEETFIGGERIDVAFYDVWLHADGLTWQDTDGGIQYLMNPMGFNLDSDPEKESMGVI